MATMWEETLASQDYLNQMAFSWEKEKLPYDWDVLFSSEKKETGENQVHLHEYLKKRAIDYLRKFGYELASIECLSPDPWQAKREERFWSRCRDIPPSLWQDPEVLKYRHIYGSDLAAEIPQDIEKANWLCETIESFTFPHEYEEVIWKNLSRALHFEKFLHHQFVGQKRFSLEGSETLVAVIEVLLSVFAKEGGTHAAFGMAHRGRLNILAHCLSKPYVDILKEFDSEVFFNTQDMGDVKYHKGYAAWREIEGQRVFVEMLPNPSHLESVGPVLMGLCAAQQKQKGFEKVLPILLHGDAALSGQGVVYESLQLSGIEGYGKTGALHLVINNQIGFTATPQQSRHTEYCTDIAKAFDCPVFHVSVERPHACLKAILLALSYRQKFKSDVFIDLIGYRKWGHNESDEPRYTNPSFYEKIDKAPSLLDIYANQISLNEEKKNQYAQSVLKELELALEKKNLFSKEVKDSEDLLKSIEINNSKALTDCFLNQIRAFETPVSLECLQKWAKAAFELSSEENVHPKIKALYAQRLEKVLLSKPLDWASAELLAYASLLEDGHSIRLSGQDSIRGTFSHRQAGLIQKEDNQFWFPLQKHALKASFNVYNSPLSEFAVLGFEYGYSLVSTEDLVIWEAQFGDFANGAQVMIDQYISSSQSKWAATSRLVLFLPHGFEGQGPEHSSARLERFLELSARGNWTIAQVSTPAQFFHLLRRQMIQSLKRPLVVFTPKGLLRHPDCVSEISEFSEGGFKEVLTHFCQNSPKVVLCSGRIYYEMCQKIHASVLCIEQLYPLPLDEILETLVSIKGLEHVIWLQEEPMNMGAASFMRETLQPEIEARGWKWTILARDRANCVSTGYPKRHKLELELLSRSLEKALI